MNSANRLTRFGYALALAFLLSLRSLAPAGFMPAFDHGAVTIVICPDSAGVSSPMPNHRHHSPAHNFAHHPCPYASAGPLGALGLDWTALVSVPVFAAILLLGRTFLFVERHTSGERPPLRGPPVPA